MGYWGLGMIGNLLLPRYYPTYFGGYSPEGEKPMAALKENAVKVFNYVKDHEAENITAKDIATALDLDPRSVNGIITSAFQRKGLMQRIEAEVENADGTHDKVKLVKLTDAGEAFDPTAKTEDAE